MNNPLRYSGTTLYQQSFHVDDATGVPNGTVLQTVANPSWMTPYVGCMLVAIGMLAHFGTMLVRFLRRRAAEKTCRYRANLGMKSFDRLQVRCETNSRRNPRLAYKT